MTQETRVVKMSIDILHFVELWTPEIQTIRSVVQEIAPEYADLLFDMTSLQKLESEEIGPDSDTADKTSSVILEENND